MNNFFRGVLVGVGIGLLIAPMRGEEMRRLLGERLQQLRGYLPDNEQLNEYMQQVSSRVSQTAGNVKEYARQAATRVRDTAEELGSLTQKSAQDVSETARSLKPSNPS
ncbi:MAG: YtxH domain-containing protein [Thermogemmatispora sp.]|uniref:YtxH domain-containing protein n=1 Tax=Thermogemmatispora sp. TaxID=1968838 RepID=UPI0026019E61|nr:YtxH domain-containing protein [Thermogemmatispora sp.]MBX5458943.1 YtxH domain-containing protein [Thermogemmatispora sp.]